MTTGSMYYIGMPEEEALYAATTSAEKDDDPLAPIMGRALNAEFTRLQMERTARALPEDANAKEEKRQAKKAAVANFCPTVDEIKRRQGEGAWGYQAAPIISYTHGKAEGAARSPRNVGTVTTTFNYFEVDENFPKFPINASPENASPKTAYPKDASPKLELKEEENLAYVVKKAAH